MLGIAIWVMISKGLLLSRVSSANDDFLEAYQQSNSTSTGHAGLAAFDPGAGAAASPLGRLYQLGRRELPNRQKDGRASGSRFAIGAQSIAALRAAHGAVQFTERQNLNRSDDRSVGEGRGRTC